MIIPVRCFTCNEIICDKWNIYLNLISREKMKLDKSNVFEDNELKYLDINDTNVKKSIEGKILDDLDIHKYCCRRMFLGNVHLISYI